MNRVLRLVAWSGSLAFLIVLPLILDNFAILAFYLAYSVALAVASGSPAQPIYGLGLWLLKWLPASIGLLIGLGLCLFLVIPALLMTIRHPNLLWLLIPIPILLKLASLIPRFFPGLRDIENFYLWLLSCCVLLALLDPRPLSLFIGALWFSSVVLYHFRDLSWQSSRRFLLPKRLKEQTLLRLGSQRDRFEAQLQAVPALARKLLLPPGGKEELYDLLHDSHEGNLVDFTFRYFDTAVRLQWAFEIDETREFAYQFAEYWRRHLSSLPAEKLRERTDRLGSITNLEDLETEEEALFCYEFLRASTEGTEWETAHSSAEGGCEFLLSRLIAMTIQGEEISDIGSFHGILEKPVPGPIEVLCKRVLAHAIQFQEGSFVRELAQNVLDEANRIEADDEHRRLTVACSRDEQEHPVVEVQDYLGMSAETIVRYLLVPNQTTKSLADGGTIGRFGQGFFTTLREASAVQIEAHSRDSSGRDRGLRVELTPLWRDGEIENVRVVLSRDDRDGEESKSGTLIRWRGREPVESSEIAQMKTSIRRDLQLIPTEDLRIQLNDQSINGETTNLARIPTHLGPISLFATRNHEPSLIVTQRDLIVGQLTRQAFPSSFPGVPEWPAQEVLFIGGLVLDLPAGLPLNRTRTGIAGRSLFSKALAHDIVRLSFLAIVESHLRLVGGHAELVRKAWVAQDHFGVGQQSRRRYRQDFGILGRGITNLSGSTADLLSEGRPFLTQGAKTTLLHATAKGLACIRSVGSKNLASLETAARRRFLGLLLLELPHPSRPLDERLKSTYRLGLLGRLCRWTKTVGVGLVLFCILGSGGLMLALPLSYIGHYLSWAFFGSFVVLFAIAASVLLLEYRFSRVAVLIGRYPGDDPSTFSTIFDVIGDLSSKIGDLLVDTGLSGVYLMYRPSRVVASANSERRRIHWNGWHARGRSHPRHLQRFLRSGNAGELGFKKWLRNFIYLLTHELAHIAGNKPHDNAFYRSQRRLLEKVMEEEEKIMREFRRQGETGRRTHVLPPLGILLWRLVRRRHYVRINS